MRPSRTSLWNDVQAVLAANRVDRATGARASHPSLLTGLVFDETGERLTPTYAVKKGTRYRYYVSTSQSQSDASWPCFAAWKSTISGLREQIKVFGAQKTIFDAQLQLAADKLELERERQDSLARQFNDFKVEVAAGAGIDALTARVAGLEISLDELATANNAVRSAIGIAVGTLAATETSVSFSNTPIALQAEADKKRPK
jgi:hypothetical protein